MDWKIEDLLRMIPKGHWSVDEYGTITDPEGYPFALSGPTTVNDATKKLYAEFFVELGNRIPSILWTLGAQTERTSAALKEVKRRRARSETIYNTAIMDVLEIIRNQPVSSLALQRALNQLTKEVKGLRKHHDVAPPASS